MRRYFASDETVATRPANQCLLDVSFILQLPIECRRKLKLDAVPRNSDLIDTCCINVLYVAFERPIDRRTDAISP